LATLTYYFFENPFRHSRYLGRRAWASLVVGLCLIAATLVVTTTEIHLHEQGGSATQDLAGLKTAVRCPLPTKADVASLRGNATPPSPKFHARVLVVGDSTACTMLPGLEAEGGLAGIKVEDAAVIGCGEVSGTIAPDYVNGSNINGPSRYCQRRTNAAVKSALKLGRPNVVVWSSSWEREPLLVGSGSHQKVLKPGSSEWVHVLMQRLTKRVRLFTDTGATVFMLTQPPFVEPGTPTHPTPEDEDFLRLNSLLAKFARNRPHVVLLNLSTLVCPGGPPCQILVNHIDLRGDGAHYTLDGSLYVARWLLPQLGISAPGENIDPLPVIKVVRPKPGATIHGHYVLDATTSFYTGVTKIEFEVTGGSLKHAMIDPTGVFVFGRYYVWNTTKVGNGTYSIRAIAYNGAGESTRSKAVTIRVVNK
jgi:hypothetical protein